MGRASANRDADAPSGTTAPTAKPITLPDKVVYMGPTFSADGVLFRHGQIFNNGLPDTWKKKAETETEFRQLLMPFARVGKATAELNNEDSYLRRAAGAVSNRHRKQRRSK